jgi:hypothetical protein
MSEEWEVSIMNCLLVGNGINIEFGGKEYLNSSIIKRLISNLQSKSYLDTFADSISNEELLSVVIGLHGELKNILKGRYDTYCKDKDEKAVLDRFKAQYDKNTKIHEIGMEDFFFILKLFHYMYNDPEEMMKDTFHGLSWILLDSIYNEGKIQDIHKSIEENKVELLRSKIEAFDEIYTVNYDCNLEEIAKRKVHYLHGDFKTLLDQYNPNTYMGKMMEEKRGQINPVTSENSHIYCNAILGFNGYNKEHIMNIFRNSEYGIEQMKDKIKSGLSMQDKMKIFSMKRSDDPRQRYAYDMMETIGKYPNLSHHIYPSEKFEQILGSISIVGMSPNNDEHIWNSILSNEKIDDITFYYKSKPSKLWFDGISKVKRINARPVEEFWN